MRAGVHRAQFTFVEPGGRGSHALRFHGTFGPGIVRADWMERVQDITERQENPEEWYGWALNNEDGSLLGREAQWHEKNVQQGWFNGETIGLELNLDLGTLSLLKKGVPTGPHALYFTLV